MSGRIESERKKNAFLHACESAISRADSDRVLDAQILMENLSMEEVDMSDLYRYGCPADWIKNAEVICGKKKRKAKYSNECATCWLYNLTDEVPVEDPAIKRLDEYESTGLEPGEIKELLEFLRWNEIKDFGPFLDTIRDIREHIV